MNRFSPLHELQPHNLNFKIPVILKFSNIFNFENFFFFKQDKDDTDKSLNLWSCHFPTFSKNNEFKFQLDNFSFGFIGKMNIGIDINCSFMSSNKFEMNFKQYQYIRPGLNYRVLCENNICTKKNELIILNKGFVTYRPHEEIHFTNCPICEKDINEFETIKNIILFKYKGKN